MFHILICDDEPFVCKEIEQALIACGIEKQIDVKVESFASGEKLLAYMGQNQDIDLLFLDIELPGSNGAETGVKIRDELKNEKVQIVYISSYEQYAMQLFRVRPFDFLIKPVTRHMIAHIFEKYIRIFEDNTQFFEYKVGRHMEKIPLSEIYYFVCEGWKISLVTGNGSRSFYGKMKEMHGTFEKDGFWSVHSSYIINVRYVKLFKGNEIVMCDDHTIPVSYAYRKDVREKILQLGEQPWR